VEEKSGPEEKTLARLKNKGRQVERASRSLRRNSREEAQPTTRTSMRGADGSETSETPARLETRREAAKHALNRNNHEKSRTQSWGGCRRSECAVRGWNKRVPAYGAYSRAKS